MEPAQKIDSANANMFANSPAERLAKAEFDACYYARMIKDAKERLLSIKAATPPGMPLSKSHHALEERYNILLESWQLAVDQAEQLRVEMASAESFPLSLIQLSDLTLAGWKIVQEQIEHLEKLGDSDPMKLAGLITQRDSIEKSIWAIEYKVMLDLLLTHEAMATLKPILESVFAAGIHAGITDSFEHFLILALAGVDGIRPSTQSLAEAQDAIADRLGIPV